MKPASVNAEMYTGNRDSGKWRRMVNFRFRRICSKPLAITAMASSDKAVSWSAPEILLLVCTVHCQKHLDELNGLLDATRALPLELGHLLGVFDDALVGQAFRQPLGHRRAHVEVV